MHIVTVTFQNKQVRKYISYLFNDAEICVKINLPKRTKFRVRMLFVQKLKLIKFNINVFASRYR